MYLYYFKLLFLLVAAHGLCDFPLQGQLLSDMKRPEFAAGLGNRQLYLAALFFHSMIHGAAVLIFTTSLYLALVMVGAHFIIDFCKVRGWNRSLLVDQVLHMVTIAFIWGMYLYGIQ